VDVKDFDMRNKKAIERIGFREIEKVPFEPESFIGNDTMKSVVLNTYLEEEAKNIIVQAPRWDERPVREDDSFFEETESQEMQPPQIRIPPILHISERSLWDFVSYHYMSKDTALWV
jgi:3'-phosphoadenosine 5'-phosphosulfate sulfotransferase (PAPS reductase)/FAD synthetase